MLVADPTEVIVSPLSRLLDIESERSSTGQYR